MERMRYKLTDVCNIQYGYAFDSRKFTDNSAYIALIRIRDVKGGESHTYYSGDYDNAYIVNEGDILIGMDGEFNIAKWKSEPALLNQRVCKIIPNKKVNADYLKYYLSVELKNIEARTAFVTVKHLSAKELNALTLEMHNLEMQSKIAQTIRSIESLIEEEKEQINNYDDLIQSRFVEIFGDPVSNPYGYEKVALSELADIKIGPFGSLLHKEDYLEGGHPLVNPSHIIDGQVVPDDKLTISDKKYKELSPYHLKKGDVVMGRRGEMGRCAVVPGDGYLCGTGSLLIRSKGDVTADYIQKIISFPSFKKTIEDMAVGQTMSNLNVPIVSKFQIIKPPMEIQDDYYTFVHQVDKLKAAEQKSLNETQLLFDSLMEKYFG